MVTDSEDRQGSPGLKVCIIGAGSIGKLFFGYLAAAIEDVYLVARGSSYAEISTRGIEVRSSMTDEVIQERKVSVVEGVDKIAALGVFDAIIVAVKAPDVREVLESIRAASNADLSRVAIVLLQNGIGVEELARAAFPTIPIIRITTTNGAYSRSTWSVTHTGEGEIHLGFWDDVRRAGSEAIDVRLRDMFTNAGLPATCSMDIREKVWEKVIVNAGINPVGALFQVENGRILETPELLRISEHLTSEAVAVARAGKFINTFDGLAAVKSVLERTRSNRNSMLQDLERRRRTEIEFINCALVRYGRELGIETPWNDMMVEVVHGFEKIARDKDNPLSFRL
ncbi:MAG: ketopantoate reductase family protein [Candidatus Lokiarchaeota archaeon]|nr:ketopantoate reductase family protein [Candidatus Lokiarchaeota archaeon]